MSNARMLGALRTASTPLMRPWMRGCDGRTLFVRPPNVYVVSYDAYRRETDSGKGAHHGVIAPLAFYVLANSMTWLILGYRRRFGGLDGDSYKDVPYVQAQCASLARQLVELS